MVGMSGGVDSSAVCMLLQDEGFEVVGLTLRMWDVPAQFSSPHQEEPNHILEARELAYRLGIEHHTLDIREAFRAEVVQAYIDEYMRGRTPNPCVMCNRFFKWKYLLDEADRLHCNRIATGHYARIIDHDGKPMLACGVDNKKDQSYFLWRLTEEQLSRTIFPLGGRDKQEIKEYVEALFGYDLNRTCNEIRPNYQFEPSCQKTVPESIIAFLESTDFENAIRLSVSLGGDADTMGAITGGIAEAYYGGVPEHIRKEVLKR